MASRRQRIKAVANLAVRRPKGPSPSDGPQLVESNGSQGEALDSRESGPVPEGSIKVACRSPQADSGPVLSKGSGPASAGSSQNVSIVKDDKIIEDKDLVDNSRTAIPLLPSNKKSETDTASELYHESPEGTSGNTENAKNSNLCVQNIVKDAVTARVPHVFHGNSLESTRTTDHFSVSSVNVKTHDSASHPTSGSPKDPLQNVRTLSDAANSRTADEVGFVTARRVGKRTLLSDSEESIADTQDPAREVGLLGGSASRSRVESESSNDSLQNVIKSRTSGEIGAVSARFGKRTLVDTQDLTEEVGLLGGDASAIADLKVPSPSPSASSTDGATTGRFGRKRFKPAVSLSAAGRRNRDSAESKKTNLGLADGSALSARKEVVSACDRTRSHNVGEPVRAGAAKPAEHKVDPNIQLHTLKDGTPQRQVAREPNLQTVTSQAPTPQAHTPQTSAGIHPHHTASESEDDSRRSSSTVTPPQFIKKLNSGSSRAKFPNLVLRPNGAHEKETQNIARTPDSDRTTIHFSSESAKDIESDTSSLYSQTSGRPVLKMFEKPRRRRLEITQRLHEAKQQFYAKFGNRTPERSRLTMFDLIFYNPTSNPMKKSEKEKTLQQQKQPEQQEQQQQEEEEEPSPQQEQTENVADQTSVEGEAVNERLAEESVDDPDAAEDSSQSFAMPVPQVKVGADGQIILDETSLVIETTGAKKSREDLANSVAVLDQGISTYNAYSKVKKIRSRDWSEKETLRFYRALQTVGTDFLLMQTIFPKRSRAELKKKFKREERTNLSLVEKALAHPLPFDLTELQKETEMLEDEENKAVKDKISEVEAKPKKKRVRKETARRGAFGRSLDKEDTGDTRNKRAGNVPVEENEEITTKKKKKRKKKQQNKSEEWESSGNESDYSSLANGVGAFQGEESDSGSHASENDAELRKSPQTTRSGRVSKPRILSDITQEEYNANWARPDRVSDAVSRRDTPAVPSVDMANTLKNLEPGSIVVLTSESTDNPGHQIVNVFMVGPRPQTHLPAVATSSVLEMGSDEQTEQLGEDNSEPEYIISDIGLPESNTNDVQVDNLESNISNGDNPDSERIELASSESDGNAMELNSPESNSIAMELESPESNSNALKSDGPDSNSITMKLDNLESNTICIDLDHSESNSNVTNVGIYDSKGIISEVDGPKSERMLENLESNSKSVLDNLESNTICIKLDSPESSSVVTNTGSRNSKDVISEVVSTGVSEVVNSKPDRIYSEDDNLDKSDCIVSKSLVSDVDNPG